MQSFEGQYDHCAENLFNANIKLEEREKVLVNAETDVGNLSRRIVLLEEEVRLIMYFPPKMAVLGRAVDWV